MAIFQRFSWLQRNVTSAVTATLVINLVTRKTQEPIKCDRIPQNPHIFVIFHNKTALQNGSSARRRGHFLVQYAEIETFV